MTKVKQIKLNNTSKRARLTVKSLISDVKKKLNKKKVESIMKMLESKYKELYQAKRIVRQIESQIKLIEDKDIEEIDIEDYKYKE